MRTPLTQSLAFTILLGCSADAAVIATYSDRPAFATAMSTSTVIDFSAGLVTSPSTDYSSAAGLTLDGVNFTGPGPSAGVYAMSVQAPTDPLRTGWDGDNVVLNGASPVGYSILATLPVGTTGVGFDLYTVAGSANPPHGQPLRVTLSSGDQFVIQTFDKPTLAFAGFTSDVPLTSVRIESENNRNPQVADFTFGIAIPEPSAAIFALIGLFGLACGRSRNR